MSLRNHAVTALLAVALASGGTAAAASHASAAGCTSSTSHSHSITSRGTVTDRTTVTERCGKAYQVWAHGWMHSYTGASDSWHSYKNGLHCPGRWTATKWLHSVSKTGTQRSTVTSTSGSC